MKTKKKLEKDEKILEHLSFKEGYEDCLEDVWQVIYETEIDADTRRKLLKKLNLENENNKGIRS